MDLEDKLHRAVYSHGQCHWTKSLTVSEAARKIKTKQDIVIELATKSKKVCVVKKVDIGNQTYVISNKSKYFLEKMWSTT